MSADEAGYGGGMFHLPLWLPLCQPALGASSQPGSLGNTQKALLPSWLGTGPREAAQLVGEKGSLMRQVTLDHPGTLKEKPLKIAEASGFSTEETAWGQEIQWQKGRLRTSSVNKVRRPGGPGTGASTHSACHVRAAFGPTSLPILTSRPVLGPSQGLLP